MERPINLLGQVCIALLLTAGMGSALAASVIYSYTIEGTVLLGDEYLPNPWSLTAGDTVTVTGTFTADLGTIGSETGTVNFGFDFIDSGSEFNSNFTFFDDFGDLLGQWDSASLVAIPIPAAVWLFISGLLALGGLYRRKKAD